MNTVHALGWTGLALGVAAAVVGEPQANAGAGDVAGLAQAIADGRDHVSALQVAQWIKDRKAGLRVIDVRTPVEFAAFNLPSSENVPLAVLPRAKFTRGETVVLYSEEGAHAGQAWVLLQLMGVRNVYFIAGGLADWRDEVMAPVLPVDASPEQLAAFARVAELSAYFGGSPRRGAPGSAATRLSEAGPAADLAAIRRRGC